MSFGYATSWIAMRIDLRWSAHSCLHTDDRADVLTCRLNLTPRRTVASYGYPNSRVLLWLPLPLPYGSSAVHSTGKVCRHPRVCPVLPPLPDIHACANGRLWTWASYVRGPAARQWRHTAAATSSSFPPAPARWVCRIASRRRCRRHSAVTLDTSDFTRNGLRPRLKGNVLFFLPHKKFIFFFSFHSYFLPSLRMLIFFGCPILIRWTSSCQYNSITTFNIPYYILRLI